MAGRHRKPTNTGRQAARIGALTAIAAAPLGIVGTASAAESSSSAPTVEKTATWDKLAHCESTGNWEADTGNGFKGGLQFTPSTWKAFGGDQYAASPENASKQQQIEVAKKVQDQQGWKAWPSCTKQLGWR